MKERPILFSAPMVRAILEGRKTMTRRVIKPQPLPGLSFAGIERGAARWEGVFQGFPAYSAAHCPHGQPGDRLWVRETWDFRPWGDGKVRISYATGGEQIEATPPNGWNPMIYNYERWRPSIFMPRWASRIDLELVTVRVERLQDITPIDAVAEGVFSDPDAYTTMPGLPYPVATFRKLWNSINAKRGFSWDDNPLVWVEEFKPVEATGLRKEQP